MTAIELFDQVGEAIPSAKRSNMFGKICYKLGRRPFILFKDDNIICKLFDETKEQAFQLAGAHYFAPMGKDRPMTNWVCLPVDTEEHWSHFAEAAFAFVEAGR